MWRPGVSTTLRAIYFYELGWCNMSVHMQGTGEVVEEILNAQTLLVQNFAWYKKYTQKWLSAVYNIGH